MKKKILVAGNPPLIGKIEDTLAYKEMVDQGRPLATLSEDQLKDVEDLAKSFKENKYHGPILKKGSHPPFVKISDTQRNELCPCGSGKKYKKCCLWK